MCSLHRAKVPLNYKHMAAGHQYPLPSILDRDWSAATYQSSPLLVHYRINSSNRLRVSTVVLAGTNSINRVAASQRQFNGAVRRGGPADWAQSPSTDNPSFPFPGCSPFAGRTCNLPKPRRKAFGQSPITGCLGRTL